MSLRQRGQRPSEASNESGGYSSPRPPSRAPPPRPTHAASVGGRRSSYNDYDSDKDKDDGPAHRNRTPRPPSSGGPGYYGSPPAGYARTNNPAFSSSSSSTIGAGYAGYQSSPAANIGQQQSYPNTAPPAYGSMPRRQPSPSSSARPRSLQFDASSSSAAAPYAGYGNVAATTNNNTNTNTNVSNPYHKSKNSSSGGVLLRALLGLFAVSFLALSGAAHLFRGVLKAKEGELLALKAQVRLETARSDYSEGEEGGSKNYGGGENARPGRGGRRRDPPRGEKKNRGNNRSGDDRAELEREIERLRAVIDSSKRSQMEISNRRGERNAALEGMAAERQDVLKEIDHATNLLEDAVDNTAKYKAMVDGAEEVEEYMRKREGALWDRIEVLQGRIARQGRREAEEWFGPGPHRVEIEFEHPQVQATNPDPDSWPRVRSKFSIELAPLDLVPHTANLFLQQVHHGLWDGCNFLSGAKHVFQIGPSYAQEEERDQGAAAEEPHYQHFYAKGLDKVSFQEYSVEFPHVQWTVGLAGRPGGPDFYINKLDNSMIHGPGGQANAEDLHNEADPCFGKVVEGTDVLKELENIPLDPETNRPKYPVVLLSAKVMVPKGNPAEGWREVERGRKLKPDDDIMPLPEAPHGV